MDHVILNIMSQHFWNVVNKMKTKLLIIISTLLFTNILYSSSPFKIQEGLDAGYSEWEIYSHLIKKGHSAEQIDEWFLQLKSINNVKKDAVRDSSISEHKVVTCEKSLIEYGGNCISKDRHDKHVRTMCAARSGNAKNKFSAKKMYETCLDVNGVNK